MIAQFNRLSAEEQEFLYKAPILVAILIAGADGKIDRKEIQEGIEQANTERKNSSPDLVLLYREIGEDFEDKLKIILQNYPVKASKRNALLTEELSRLNTVLPKVSREFAAQYYRSLCDLSMKIAESSGGVLGMKSVGEDEAAYVKLPMIKDPSVQ